MSPPPTREAVRSGEGNEAGPGREAGSVIPQRWLRIIPIALIMYSIDYVDRTNISLLVDRRISTLPQDMALDGRMIGVTVGIFSLGYFLLQGPGGYLAQRWSPKKFISVCLVAWSFCAIGCGLAQSFGQLSAARFFLGVSEAGVFPAMMVLLARWFPARERVRATAFFLLNQPLAVAVTAPITGWLLGACGWRATLIFEGLLPVVLLPVWWYCIFDHPREAKWLRAEERDFIEQSVAKEVAALEPEKPGPMWRNLLRWEILTLTAISFLMTCFISGLMPFFTSTLKGQNFTAFEYGILFGIPYLVAAPVMIVVSWHSDLKQERRLHLALVVGLAGASLILSVVARSHFWSSYALMICAISTSFAYLGPFFTIPTEMFPRAVLGLLIGTMNSIGNIGGFVGPYFVGWLSDIYHGVSVPFVLLGIGVLAAAALAVSLPRSKRFEEVGGTRKLE